MAGYWPISFFVCFHGWRRSQGLCKKGTRQISSYFDQQTWSIKDSLLSKKNFTLIRIKNDFLFFLRAGKERRPCSQQNKSTSHLICFLGLFYFFLPLFMNFLNSTPWNFHEIEAGNSERARCGYLACLLGNQSKHKICTILPTGAVSYVKDDMTVPELLAF